MCPLFADSWFGISGSQRRYIGVMMLTLTPRYVRVMMCMYTHTHTPTLFLSFAFMSVFTKISCCQMSQELFPLTITFSSSCVWTLQ